MQISVDGPGTGDGFELFCQGETDVSDASRPIDPEEEIPACEENGIEYIELKVGIDGITVLTSPENDQVECLSFQDLYALLGPESEGFENWSDANDLGKKVGGSGDYPDASLDVTAPGEESGTYDSFAELVLEDIAVEQGISEDGPFVRPDYTASGDDNVIIQGIAGNPTSLGWVGFAFYEQNTDAVRALQVEAEEGAGCVEPTYETISGGEYPIARDLYVYVNAAKAEENPALAAYIDFYLSEDGLATVSEVGYVDLPEESITETSRSGRARRRAPARARPGSRLDDSAGGYVPAEPGYGGSICSVGCMLMPRYQEVERLTDDSSRQSTWTSATSQGNAARHRRERIVRLIFLGAAVASVVISGGHHPVARRPGLHVHNERRPGLAVDEWLVPTPGSVRPPDDRRRDAHRRRHRDARRSPTRTWVPRSISRSTREPRVRRILKPIIEILAGIPSVVIGFFALTFISPEIVRTILAGSFSLQHDGRRYRRRDPRHSSRGFDRGGLDAIRADGSARGGLRAGRPEENRDVEDRFPRRDLGHRRFA